MKVHSSLLIAAFVFFAAYTDGQTYVGSTPADLTVRRFLQISLTDSIDFIRWKLEVGKGNFDLQCRYGLAKAGTPGFTDEQRVSFEGDLTKVGNLCDLKHNGKNISLLEVNTNLFHLLDDNNNMLIGNGGYSYVLNSTTPVETDEFNIKPVQSATKSTLVFEGRTPCQKLSSLLDLHKSEACNKMKWYFIFYTDSATGKPLYYLKGGMGYRKETMERGKWDIITRGDGRIVYQVRPDNGLYTLHLLKGDENILFFIDGNGRLLVGNEDFSYTLNRRKGEYPAITKL